MQTAQLIYWKPNFESGPTSPSLGLPTSTNNTPALFTLNISFRDGIRWQRVRRRLEPAAEHFAGRFHPSKKRTSCFKLFRQKEENHFFSETKFEGLGRCRRRRRCCRRCRRCRRRCCCCWRRQCWKTIQGWVKKVSATFWLVFVALLLLLQLSRLLLSEVCSEFRPAVLRAKTFWMGLLNFFVV